MKIAKLSILLISLVFAFTACTSKNKQTGMRKLKENHYDFSDFKQFFHKGIYFHLPNYFKQDYNTSYLFKKDGISLSNFDAGIYFSCEKFDQYDADDFKFILDDTSNDLNAIHQYYIGQRENSLKNVKISIVHERTNKANLKGFYQIIEGTQNSLLTLDESMVYLIATFEKTYKDKINYYVMQLISTKEMAAYLVDDFKQIMNGMR